MSIAKHNGSDERELHGCLTTLSLASSVALAGTRA